MPFGRPKSISASSAARVVRPGVEHVVDEQNLLVVDGKRDLRAADDRLRPDGVAHQVVAIERDVERAGRHVVAGDLLQAAREAPRDVDAARTDADQREVIDAFVAFDDFVGDAGEGAADAVRVHDDRRTWCQACFTSLRSRWTALKS